MNGGLILQAVVAGLAAGAVYWLVAVGFSLVFRLSLSAPPRISSEDSDKR